MNLDLENVETFLKRISLLIDNGFSDEQASTAYRLTSSMALNEEQETEFNIVYQGNQEKLVYRVFMDDVESPDLYFFSSSELLPEAIANEYENMCEELGM